MRVIPRMDAGPIIDSESLLIEDNDTGSDVRRKIAHACIPLLARNMDRLFLGNTPCTEQDEKEASYCRKLLKSDGQLNFNLSARNLIDRNRAFADWPVHIFGMKTKCYA